MSSAPTPNVEAVLRGEPRAIAQGISAIENGDGDELLRRLFPRSGRALLVGVTGAPGAGKSTLVDALAVHLRGHSKTAGILAVDPTSPYSGGAILGDRIRMQRHHGDDGVFIRSMATRGAMGGLARATTGAASLLDAAGKDVVIVETVGVGQDEVDIARLADLTLVIVVPGMGDDVQTLKAGLMEIADIFVINKSDRPGAERVEHELQAMLSTGHSPSGWVPPIVKTVAVEGRGVEELWSAAEECVAYFREHGLLEKKKAMSWRQRLLDMLRDRLLQKVNLTEEALESYSRRIARRETDPYSVVEEILRRT